MARPQSPAPITFVVPGQRQALRGGAAPGVAGLAGLPGVVKDSVRVAARRAGSEGIRVSAVPGEDVVVLQIAGGPPLLLHPENARDLLLGQGSAKRSLTPANGDVAVPVQLRWQGLEQAAPTRTRGFLGDVVLSAFQVLTGFAKDSAVTLATSAVLKRVDGQVEAGVYALRPESLQPLKGSGLKVDKVPASPEPMLVLIHGTFVETVSTFGKLWALHPQRVRALFTSYGGRVYALDHPTLGASPIANALTLVQALPQGARLHLATHSRGGLVAEVLARVAGQSRLTVDDLAFFAGAGLAGQRAELQALAKAVAEQGITVERVVRVACPARGTLLASKRLDAYLSVLKWSLELTGVPALPEVVDFLAEVARRRADPAEIPGLAAMIPGTPLVNWLNAAEEPIAGDLRVVAGDLQGDSVTSWLKTLLADAYYWTDNDIVVQTRSMYGGTPREGGASFLLDQGGRVTHFNYFANERTVAAVVDGLTQAQPAGFRLIGPLSWAGQDSGGVRAARRARAAEGPAGGRPAVFVLPGILGSNLAADGKRIWLSLRLIGGLSKLRYQPGVDDKVTPDGAISLVYDDLIEHLEATHEVIEFAFDWRRPIEEEARRLADAVEQALEARVASGQPVRLLAHSMGGVVARTLQLERPATWRRLMSRPGARLLMLGTPNGGSWAPMQVLSGDDTFGNALASFGSPLRDRQARQMMAEMPGFIQLQADLLDPLRALDQEATWRKLADDDLRTVQEANWWHRSAGEAMQDAYVWGVPPQAVLDRARALRERLDRQSRDDLPAFADKLLLVVGHAKFTPDGYEWTDQGLVYLNATDGGDGRVPLASALLPGVRTWTLDCEHGSLPDAKRAFAAFVELLAQGDTRLLPLLAAAAGTGTGGTRGATATPAVQHVRSRPSRGQLSATPAQHLRSVFDSDRRPAAEPAEEARGAALQVTVLNGNLAFIRQPLLVGHYRTSLLTGTEGVVNRLVGGAMQAALDAGLYPSDVGTHQIFVNTWHSPDNPWRPPRPQAAVVVGLGDEGSLTEMRLRDSVRQATIAWAQRVAEDPLQAGAEIEFAATLLGSGGMGISPSATARAIAQGVREANDRLAGSGWPLVSRLTLVELYLDRAAEAWRGLQVLVTASPDRFGLAPTIASGTGPLRWQSDSGYRGAEHDFITATAGALPGSIDFTLDTRRARTEMRSQRMQGKLLLDLVARASTDINDDPNIGRTLFQLLVPLEVEPFLGGTQRMLLELDDSTAPIPWELLETPDDGRGHADPRPWAIRSQLLRKLRKTSYRTAPRDACAEDAVLVIGEPAVDTRKYGPLPGALAEAKAVVAQITAAGALPADRVTALVDNDDAASVISALLARRYRIVHVAGHGEAGANGGVVLSGDTFLGPREIETMRTVPELVFVNCCHLAGRDAAQTLAPPPPLDRSAFAAGVADKLIEIGVRCVVAAGWAVEDGPAETFATTFYRELLAGATFISAVGAAREAAWDDNPSGKTWAAYQCYGDPGWTFRAGGGDAQTVLRPIGDEYASIASALGLALALEEAAVHARWASAQSEDEGQAQLQAQLQKVRLLEARFAALWGGMGAVAEAYAVAYAEAGDFDAAIAWYERAVHADDASASLKAYEQFENLRARQAWQTVAQGQPTAAALAAARERIVHAIERLQSLADRHATVERGSLIGSAWKRLAMLEQRAGNAAAARTALDAAARGYGHAEVLAAAAGSSDLFYPALNRMALELVVHGGQKAWRGLDPARTQAVRQSLAQRTRTDPDIWSCVGQIDVELYEALAEGRLAASLASLAEGYANIHARLNATKAWRTMADQARFVLEPVLARTRGKEREAAQALLDQLLGYAQGPAGR